MNEFDPDGWLGPRETGLADGGALSANPSLTGRQAAFCDSYADLGNAAAAARQAGYAAGSAKVTGSRLLTNANVLARIEALRAVRARARDADRQLLLERLEETWQGAMAAEQFGAAMRTLRLMAELGGLMGTKAREVTDSDDLDSGEPAGPVLRGVAGAAHARRGKEGSTSGATVAEPDIGALVQKARLDLARTRPGPLPPDQRFLVQAFAGTPNLKPPSNGVEPQ
jgi:phage terminase small subunit